MAYRKLEFQFFWTSSFYSILHFACPEWLLGSMSWLMICLQDDLVGLLPFSKFGEVNLKDLPSKKIHLFWATGQDFFWAVRGQWKIRPIFLFLCVVTLTKFCAANVFLDFGLINQTEGEARGNNCRRSVQC